MAALSDQVEMTSFSGGDRLFVKITGLDRPSVMAHYTRKVDGSDLYVDSLSYHLGIPGPGGEMAYPFDFQFVAKGNAAGIAALQQSLTAEEDSNTAAVAGSANFIALGNWHAGQLVYVSLHIPDRPGITAEFTEIVAKIRDKETSERGNILQCRAQTENSGGPQGGVPYFHIQAQIHTLSSGAGNAITRELEDHFGNEVPEQDMQIIPLR